MNPPLDPAVSPRPSACPGLWRIVAARDGGICRIKLPGGLLLADQADAVAEAAATAAVADTEALAANISTVRHGRTALVAALANRGLEVPDSGGNFLWLPVGEGSAALEAACLAESVSVRSFAGEGVRVTVGSRDAEAAVLRGVDAWLAGGRV